MTLAVNMLIGWRTDSMPPAPVVERILWMDPMGTDVAVIALHHPAALPTMRSSAAITAALATGQAQVLTDDPYAWLLARAEASLSPAQRAVRDKRWALIQPLLQCADPTLCTPTTRAQAMQRFEQSHLAQQGLESRSSEAKRRRKALRKQVLKCLRWYWQRGQVPNALLPDFARCGGNGKERQAQPNTKRGRASLRAAKSPATPMIGINITGPVRQVLLDGFQRFYVKGGLPWREAYDQTMEVFFSTIILGETGRYRYELLPKDQRPTLGQFRYWGQKTQDLTKTLTQRKGQRAFDLHYRPLVGDPLRLAFGPGSLVQEDATIADTYLVSELDRSRIIGRPVIYVLLDVFSRMIVGLAISLDGPSWQGVMSAIEQMSTDKVAFCAEYGITIAPEDWPCHFLPETLMGDRGELFTADATPLIAKLGVRLLNTAPYRADWKGVIERFFRLLKNDTTITWLPGAVHERKPGERDARLDACLTLREFREIIIRCVLHYNTARRLTQYRLDEYMIPDHVQPYPVDLWQWGIVHRRGHLRSIDRDAIRLALLPHAEAHVTRGGIMFKGVVYTCERALREQWYVRASLGTWKIPVVYDLRNTDALYLLLDQENEVEVATIADGRFAHQDWLDVEDYLTTVKQATQEHRGPEEQALSDLRQEVRAIVTTAHDRTAEVVKDLSHAERLAGIRANRQEERQRLYAAEAWTPPPVPAPAAPEESERFTYAGWIRHTQATLPATTGGPDVNV